jgi:predicted SAM-dependent methyltransferase
MALRQILKNSQIVRGAYEDLLTVRYGYLTRRKAAIHNYLKKAPRPALHLGAEGRHLPDWLETNIHPGKGLIFLDATKPFPLPDSSFDFVYGEHMIEHVRLEGARTMLTEARRVLRPGGVLRLATPDLGFLIGLFNSPGELERRYMRWMATKFPRTEAPDEPAYILNLIARGWGHQFLYDAKALESELRAAGFTSVERVSYGESSHDMLRGIERHHINVGNEELVRAETMLFEAS